IQIPPDRHHLLVYFRPSAHRLIAPSISSSSHTLLRHCALGTPIDILPPSVKISKYAHSTRHTLSYTRFSL
ncbi:hypothetical protein BDQ17DRAFT_1344448, partial [Cyathus striatus]